MDTANKYQRKLHRVGALLVHSLNGSLRDMEELTSFLTSYNIMAMNVLLPSQGTHKRDMLPISWSEWSNVVRKQLQKLKQWCKYVFLIGHSLGGALCLHLAASEPITGIITMCAPVYMYPWMLPVVRLARLTTPVPPTEREDVRGYEALRRYKPEMYGITPMAPIEKGLQYLPSLRTELPSITVPTLVMTAIHDHLVPSRDGQAIYRLIGSQEKYLVKFRQSYHLLMKDRDQEEVFARTLEFIQSHARSR